jgi:hypothetical protein
MSPPLQCQLPSIHALRMFRNFVCSQHKQQKFSVLLEIFLHVSRWYKWYKGLNDLTEERRLYYWYGLDNRGLIPGRGYIYLRHHFQTSSGAHSASYLVGIEAHSRGKAAEHSPPSSAEVTNA